MTGIPPAARRRTRAGTSCVRLVRDDVPTSVAPDPDLAAALVDGGVALGFATACDADGRIVLVHVVPVWVRGAGDRLRGQELWRAAERQGCSAQLQRWLLREACAQVAELPDDRVRLTVSLPAGHLASDGLPREVAAALVESGLAAARLTLALTEEAAGRR